MGPYKTAGLQQSSSVILLAALVEPSISSESGRDVRQALYCPYRPVDDELQCS